MASNKITICEVLREINDLHQDNSIHSEQIRKLLFIAQGMAKKMNYKLLENNKDYDKGWWKDNPNYEKNLKKRLSKDYIEYKDNYQANMELFCISSWTESRIQLRLFRLAAEYQLGLC